MGEPLVGDPGEPTDGEQGAGGTDGQQPSHRVFNILYKNPLGRNKFLHLVRELYQRDPN